MAGAENEAAASTATTNKPFDHLASYRLFESIFFGPPRWFKRTVMEANQQDYPYYHQRYRRVPTIDECYFDDAVCRYEANEQFKRDRQVESYIVNLLNNRFNDCIMYHRNTIDLDEENVCSDIKRKYERARLNFYIKYGDLTYKATAEQVLMKQKHRLIWERRHGENTLEGRAAKAAEETQVAA